MMEKTRFLFKLSVWISCFTLVSCQTVHPVHQTSIQQTQSILTESIETDRALSRPPINRNIPPRINAALMPPLSRYLNPARDVESRFDVAANKIPAKDFFMGLVAGTKYNMIIHPNISGTISINLKDVTIKQAMDAVRDIYGFEYRRTSYGFEILPPELETQLFHINYLDVQRTGRSYTQLTTGQVSNKVGTVTSGNTATGNVTSSPVSLPGMPQGLGTISSIETRTEMRFWKDLEKAIQGMVPKDNQHYVTVNSQAGIISVRAYPAELHRIGHYIESLQTSLNRQVILEAKILEVVLDDQYQAGIDWSILGNPAFAGQNNTGDNSGGMGQASNGTYPGTDLTTLNGIFAIRVNGNFKVLINLLQTQGNVQVLSSPHIATVNNQKAVIKVGSDEFFVTGVSTTNTIVGNNTLPSQDVSLTPFFSGITLDVTPEINSKDTVVLHIHPSVSRVTQQTKTIGLGSSAPNTPNVLVLPLAFSTIRESDNIVRAKNGQIVVIGGLMQNNMKETIAATPWISKVPFIGNLFRRTEHVSVKSELVILLRPIVASNHNQIEKLEEQKKFFTIYKRPFHAGALPKIFGNEAERGDQN